MSIRTKILLAVVGEAIIAALAIGAIGLFNIGSSLIIAAIVMALGAVAIYSGLYVADNIAKPLNDAIGMVREMSRGRLGARLDMSRGDEIGVMAKAMNEFARGLRINVVGAMNKIAAGDLCATVVLRDEEDEINAAVKRTMESLREFIVDDCGGVLAAAANGDLSQRLTGVYDGEFAVLRDDVNAIVRNLDRALRLVAETTVSQVSSASFLEEASLSIEAMSAITKRNADNSKQAKLLADEECVAVSEGGAAVKRVAEAVDRIKAASDNTAKIIKAIDGISAEASLLAFNVDIEAAHAGEGESGNGIARVAAEARDLAAHCAEAAKNAAGAIEESVKNADGGVKVAKDAAKTFSKIVDRADKVDGLIAEIAEVSGKQARGIEQVGTVMSRMNQATQRNITGDFVPSVDVAEQGGRGSWPAPQKQYAALPGKRAYKAATLGIMTRARTANARKVVAIEECELWR